MPEGLRNNEEQNNEEQKREEGGDFLKEKYADLPNSPEVESAVKRQEIRSGEKVKNKTEKIEAYLKRLDEIFSTEDEEKKKIRVEFLKEKLHDKFVIKEIPESYFEHQQQIARERGHGDLEYSEEGRRQEKEVIVKDQEQSLDNWVDYLGSEDATYPNWLKYWAFRSVTGLSQYDKVAHEFKKRSKTTTAPFPDINREALAYVLDAVEKQYKTKKTKKKGEVEIAEPTDEDWEKLLKTQNFGKLYAHAIEKITPASEEEKENIQGEWVKYDQSDNPEDAKPLYESLQGHGTGWCTAGEAVAQNQLKAGDFYVFYSKDKQGLPKIPRVAIRMANGEIAEVRGIEADQNLESVMVDTAKEKYSTLPGGEKYEKKCADMKRLTEIEKKFINTDELKKKLSSYEKKREINKLFDTEEPEDPSIFPALKAELEEIKARNAAIELTTGELKFLYELDDKIEGFGYQKDPRIEELRNQRDAKKDYAKMFDCKPEEVVIGSAEHNQYSNERGWVEATKEVLSNSVVVFIGSLDFGKLRMDVMPQNLKYIVGDVRFRQSGIENLGNLEFISGQVDFFASKVNNFGKLKYIGGQVSIKRQLKDQLELTCTKHGELNYGETI